TLPLVLTFSFSAAVPAFLTVLEALPTTLEPLLAVAVSLPLPGTLIQSLTPPDLVALVTLVESDFVVVSFLGGGVGWVGCVGGTGGAGRPAGASAGGPAGSLAPGGPRGRAGAGR